MSAWMGHLGSIMNRPCNAKHPVNHANHVRKLIARPCLQYHWQSFCNSRRPGITIEIKMNIEPHINNM